MTGFPPSVDDGPTDRRGLRVLDLEECLSRTAHHEVGRVAFASDGDMTILPVTYLLDGAGVSFLTTWGSKLQVAADGGRMAFEVDETDPATRTGWSVLFQGSASIVILRWAMVSLVMMSKPQNVKNRWVSTPSPRAALAMIRPG